MIRAAGPASLRSRGQKPADFGPKNTWIAKSSPGQIAQRQESGAESAMSEERSGIGDRPKRREDLRFLTGRGAYRDDLTFAIPPRGLGSTA
jgi:hypothetical protein